MPENKSIQEQRDDAVAELELKQAQYALGEYEDTPLQEGWGSVVPSSEYPSRRGNRRLGQNTLLYRSSIEGRQHGSHLPYYETEQEVADIQTASRTLAAITSTCVGATEALRNYTIHTGFKHTIQLKKGHALPPGVIEKCQEIIDEFIEENKWTGNIDRSIHDKSREDGEAFLCLYPQKGEVTRAMVKEPEKILEPARYRELEDYLDVAGLMNYWHFGIHTQYNGLLRCEDPKPVGYHIVEDSAGSDWDYLPENRVVHIKRNVPLTAKRGIPDFFHIQNDIENEAKLRNNTAKGAAVLAAIVGIRQHKEGVERDAIQSFQRRQGNGSREQYEQGGGSETRTLAEINEPHIRDISAGMEFMTGPLGNLSQPVYIEVIQMILRAIGMRWNMPEYMISGDASNGNFSSTLVAESPFVKSRQSDQEFYARYDIETLYKVLYFAWQQGKVEGMDWTDLKAGTVLQVEKPDITARDEKANTERYEKLNGAGVMSLKTWRAKEDLDEDEEEANLAEEGVAGEEVAAGQAGAMEAFEQKIGELAGGEDMGDEEDPENPEEDPGEEDPEDPEDGMGDMFESVQADLLEEKKWITVHGGDGKGHAVVVDGGKILATRSAIESGGSEKKSGKPKLHKGRIRKEFEKLKDDTTPPAGTPEREAYDKRKAAGWEQSRIKNEKTVARASGKFKSSLKKPVTITHELYRHHAITGKQENNARVQSILGRDKKAQKKYSKSAGFRKKINREAIAQMKGGELKAFKNDLFNELEDTYRGSGFDGVSVKMENGQHKERSFSSSEPFIESENQKRAKKGGEIGVNGEDYKGGQFISTTDADKKAKQKKKRGSGKTEVDPYDWRVLKDDEFSIWVKIRNYIEFTGEDNMTAKFNASEQTVKYYGIDVPETERLIDLYNSGERIGKREEIQEGCGAGTGDGGGFGDGNTCAEGGSRRRGPGLMKMSEISVDADRFQFKFEGVGKDGVTKQFAGVEFDPEWAGLLYVWEDKADGKTYVVNGHHRKELADRTGWDGDVQVFYINRGTEEEARAFGAMVNIADGNGTPLDTAKFMRDMGLNGDEAKAFLTKHNVSIKSDLIKDGSELTNLNDQTFNDVALGKIPQEQGQSIGRHLVPVGSKDEREAIYQSQRDIVTSINNRPQKITVTNAQVEVMARSASDAKLVAAPSLEQGELFARSPKMIKMMADKAIVQERVEKTLKGKIRAFGAVSDSREELFRDTGVGEVSSSAAKSKKQENKSLLDTFKRELKLKGEVGRGLHAILDKAAEEHLNSTSTTERKDIKNNTVTKVIELLDKE